MRRIVLTALLASALAACSDSSNSAAADSDLARDLALANQTPVAPLLSDTALSASPEPRATPSRPSQTKTPAPARAPRRVAPVAPPPVQTTVEQPSQSPAPTPAPPPAAPPARRAPGFDAGTAFTLSTKAPVCTTNLPGDKITATITSAVIGENGASMPVGTVVVLEVATVTPGDTPETAQIALRVRSILLNDQPVNMEGNVAILSELERREIPRDKNADRRKVVGGAVAGAIIGQIMGKDTKSTVIGAAAGAAAGTAAAAASRKYDACLPAGGSLRVTTSHAIVLGD